MDFFKINYIPLLIITLLIVVDIITGIIKCYYNKSDKTIDGGFQSSVMRKCGLKKIGVLMFIVAVNILTNYFNVSYIGDITYIYYIATEGLSVCENLTAIGVPIPPIITRLLEEKKKGGDDNDSTDNSK